MPTIQQHIFPPKPKGIVTPLSPRQKAVSDVTPLSPKQDIAEAIDNREVVPVILEPEPEPEPVIEKPKAPRGGNRLLTGKASRG